MTVLDTFTETFTAPDQAVAAVNLGQQGPSSVSESVSYPDATTGRENGKKSREAIISETILIE